MFEQYMSMVKEYKWLVAGISAGILMVGLFFIFHQPSQADTSALIETPRSEVATSSTPQVPSQSDTTASASSVILVDVKGAVVKEGIYELPAEARVNDVIQAAGGFTEQADKKSVNLAQKLTDEAVVYVARQGEEISVVSPPKTAAEETGVANKPDKVHLNSATVSELTTIPGIGEKRANDIISYRDSNGGFHSVDDLNNVSGIGDKTLEHLRPYVTVD
ncbi:helix-hairpin-helix domain-containing protein [Streptococcus ovis]|uniref:helix-hairpin-helix domain-containing protein n=1 Tax=Streptococcus ovis TaxID=82806 RepID=UPI000368DE16|nr:helix-hairpin-helix domain-containing protein [Streptococcus ovis]